MRSEERAGIIVSVLLLFWGTLITEPFRICTLFFCRGAQIALGKIKVNPDGLAGVLLTIVFMTLLSVALLIISKAKAGSYIPVVMFAVTLVGYMIKALRDGYTDLRKAIALIIIVAVLGVVYFFKAERILIWISDICIFSIPVFLLAGLLTMPLGRLSATMGKILYINNYQRFDLTLPFEGFLTLPGIVWGIFFLILVSLPQIYYSFSRRRG